MANVYPRLPPGSRWAQIAHPGWLWHVDSMHVLVTGASGFVGTRLVPQLRDQGHSVTAHDLDVDITDAGAVDRALEAARPDAIIHLAAQSSVQDSWKDPFGLLPRQLPRERETSSNRARRYCPTHSTALDQFRRTLRKPPRRRRSVPGDRPPAPGFPLRPDQGRSGISRVRGDARAEPTSSGCAPSTTPARDRPIASSPRVSPGKLRRSKPVFSPPRSASETCDRSAISWTSTTSFGPTWTYCNPPYPPTSTTSRADKGLSIEELLDMLLAASTSRDRIEIEVDPDRVRPTDCLFGDATRLQQATGWAPEDETRSHPLAGLLDSLAPGVRLKFDLRGRSRPSRLAKPIPTRNGVGVLQSTRFGHLARSRPAAPNPPA